MFLQTTCLSLRLPMNYTNLEEGWLPAFMYTYNETDMMEKYEWKKAEKAYYLPKGQPQLIKIPAFKFFMLSGQGNPNDPFFVDYVQCLYALSYAAKMRWKKEEGLDYSVYPLEGVWTFKSVGQIEDKVRDKNNLVFDLMIRQPDFISEAYADEIVEQVKRKKQLPLLEQVTFNTVEEGLCVQMLHTGSYDDEPETLKEMETYAFAHNLSRIGSPHREIYLSDARRVEKDKLKTVLRFQVG